MSTKITNTNEIRENNSVRISQTDLKKIKKVIPSIIRENGNKKLFINSPALREYLFNQPKTDDVMASDLQAYQVIEQDLHKEINSLCAEIESLQQQLADVQDKDRTITFTDADLEVLNTVYGGSFVKPSDKTDGPALNVENIMDAILNFDRWTTKEYERVYQLGRQQGFKEGKEFHERVVENDLQSVEDKIKDVLFAHYIGQFTQASQAVKGQSEAKQEFNSMDFLDKTPF